MKRIIVFESIHYTIKAEKLISETAIPYEVITTPKYLTKDCGMSLEIEGWDELKIIAILDKNKIKFKVYDKQ